MRHVDLFSGIGGFALAAQMAGGYETVAFCEIDPWCQRHLRRYWPWVALYDDVRSLPDRIECDVLTAGFPCQDISHAGKRAGIDGERSGLWSFIPPVIRRFRPRGVLLENVTALLDRGLGRVLGDLAAIGYDAEWHCLGADALGASQHRERIWILAYPDDAGFQRPVWQGQPHAARQEWPSAHSEPLRSACGYWPPGPRAVDHIPRMADGPADRVHRLRALGNAIVPQVAAVFLRAIRECYQMTELNSHEIEALEMLSGERKGEWGAWVAACMEALRANRFCTADFQITERGREYLRTRALPPHPLYSRTDSSGRN